MECGGGWGWEVACVLTTSAAVTGYFLPEGNVLHTALSPQSGVSPAPVIGVGEEGREEQLFCKGAASDHAFLFMYTQ